MCKDDRMVRVSPETRELLGRIKSATDSRSFDETIRKMATINGAEIRLKPMPVIITSWVPDGTAMQTNPAKNSP